MTHARRDMPADMRRRTMSLMVGGSEAAEYPFKGLDLKPLQIISIASEMFAGQTVDRARVLQVVSEYHVRHGGAASPVDEVFEQVLAKMFQQGHIELVEGGLWRFPRLSDLDTRRDLRGFHSRSRCDGDPTAEDVRRWMFSRSNR